MLHKTAHTTNLASLAANAPSPEPIKSTDPCYKFAITLIVLLNVALATALALGIAAHAGQCLTSLNSTAINVLIYGSAAGFALEILWQIVKGKKSEREIPPGYQVLSWNIGSNADFSIQGKTTSQNVDTVLGTRDVMLQAAASRLCDNVDFICLQQTSPVFPQKRLEDIFQGFTFRTDFSGGQNEPHQDTAVGWSTRKFTQRLSGVATTSSSTRSAWVQLQDKANGNTILLSSAHITRTHGVFRAALNDHFSHPSLYVMGVSADTELNSPGEDYRSSGDSHSTFFDQHLKRATRVDYIYAKSSNGTPLLLIPQPVPQSYGYENDCLRNPSNHAPVLERLVTTGI